MEDVNNAAASWLMAVPAFAALAAVLTCVAASSSMTWPFIGRQMSHRMRYAVILIAQCIAPAYLAIMCVAYGLQDVAHAYGEWMTALYGVVIAASASVFMLMPAAGVRAFIAVRRDRARNLEAAPYKRPAMSPPVESIWRTAARNQLRYEQAREADPDPMGGTV